MAPRATEGERAWLDIDSHLIRDESGQWRVRCELCNKHYKLPGGYRSLDAPTVAPEHAHEAKRNLKKHIIRIHKRTFNPSTVDSRYRCNEAAFELIGTDREVQAGFGHLKKRYRQQLQAKLDGLEAPGKADRARHDEWAAERARRLAMEPEDIMIQDPIPEDDENLAYEVREEIDYVVWPVWDEWAGHKGNGRLPRSLLTVLIHWRIVLFDAYDDQKRKRGGGSARVLKEYRTRIQDFDDILARIFTVPVNIAAEHEESRLFSEILSPLYHECQRPLPEDEIRTDEDQEGSDRLLRWIQKAYRPFLGKRVPDEFWDQLESEHRTWQAALRPFATTVLVHVPEPLKPPTDADLEPERKKTWDSWIVECAHRWLALSSEQRDAYCWMRKKGSGGEGAASTSGAREEDAISEHSSATGQHSDHGSAAGSEAESTLSTLSELTSLSELERGLDTGT
ncbi:BZ3500_MvSof-1268-A1-R1_Chr4-2g06965 [Microbotryum saponariae]|uniref:BZ3500_MvSof-1268-A1-R1_Chr4-2g06965 protein n=1 Tax=Microbotryum saponariae TaxID=289078 RepID=A0A2X0LMV5_9BASI|nr:BZ3500_MvSof-1268-A1-R1_Chr4-2g06965 [Microbotryum saponariae]SDA06630.1 BZ3501_MvSof-1269-A2-R1_Chr4-2g06676 [Microbotryum saponariae]